MSDTLLEAVNIGVIGVGYIGRNHVRILSSLPGVRLVGIYDQSKEIASSVAEQYGVKSYIDSAELFEVSDALIIAVPTHLHYEFAYRALESGIDVLVEKPITDNLQDGISLCQMAESKNLILQVGHVERFNPVAFELTRFVQNPFHISCERLSPYLSEWISESGVILDLMIHDLDIVLSLLGTDIRDVSATKALLRSGTEDIAVANVLFENGCIASFTASRVSQAKVRRIAVTQQNEYVIGDLLRQTLAVHRYVSSDYFFDTRMGFKQETVTEVPYLSQRGEPLELELSSFVEAISGRKQPVVGGAEGVLALKLALAVMTESACAQWDGFK